MSVHETAGQSRRRPDRSAAVLALALLSVELVAAMQSYVTGTITPLMASDLDAQQGYGLLAATTQASLFLTMPLGAALLSRWSAATMLAWLTPAVVVGGVVSAVAPTFAVFLGGRVLAALASGALMTVGMSALVTALPGVWRRGVLAGYAMVWLVASLVGPLYAGSTAAVIGWRWAVVAYLPLLLVARAVVILQLRRLDRSQRDRRRRLGLVPAAALAGGITLVSAAGPSWAALAVAGVGATVVVLAAARILPAGTLRARPGRPSSILLLGTLCGAYFGAQAIVAITAHDILGRGAGSLALLLGIGGAGWSVLGLACSRWPARDRTAYRRRMGLGAVLLAGGAGLLVVATLPATPQAWWWLVAGWGCSGLGMGTCYVDTLNQVLDEPSVPDGIGPSEAAQSLVMSEVVGTALVSTTTASAMAWAVLDLAGRGWFVPVVYAALGLLALLLMPLARRAAPEAERGMGIPVDAWDTGGR
jgi:MFS family permease